MLYRDGLKRAFDLAFGLAVSLLAGPIVALAVIAIRLDSQGAAFFRQRRLGRDGSSFELLKLRTMTAIDRVPTREIHAGDPEVTRIGRWLRRTKIDELPQVWNVLRGDMSIVGPRPPLTNQLEQYPDWARRRLEVRPGLTGLAQIHGGIHLSWPDRWRWDVAYVERLTLLLDLSILVRTVGVVLLGESRFVQPPPPIDGAPANADAAVDKP